MISEITSDRGPSQVGVLEVVEVEVELEEVVLVLGEEVVEVVVEVWAVTEPVSSEPKGPLSEASVQPRSRTLHPTTNRLKDTSL